MGLVETVGVDTPTKVAVITAVIAGATLVVTLLGVQLPTRRTLHVRGHARTHTWSKADGSQHSRTEVVAELATGRLPVVVEAVSVVPVDPPNRQWWSLQLTLPPHAEDRPTSEAAHTWLRMEAFSRTEVRLGTLSAPPSLIKDGTVEIRVVALLARSGTRFDWPRRIAWVMRVTKRLAQRRSRPLKVPAAVQEDPGLS